MIVSRTSSIHTFEKLAAGSFCTADEFVVFVLVVVAVTHLLAAFERISYCNGGRRPPLCKARAQCVRGEYVEVCASIAKRK